MTTCDVPITCYVLRCYVRRASTCNVPRATCDVLNVRRATCDVLNVRRAHVTTLSEFRQAGSGKGYAEATVSGCDSSK
jgi:hypothetical protein